jgi:hypothetical protein
VRPVRCTERIVHSDPRGSQRRRECRDVLFFFLVEAKIFEQNDRARPPAAWCARSMVC